MQQENTERFSDDSNEANLSVLFELLNHNETNYALFALSRLATISKLLGSIFHYEGPELTATRLIPELIETRNRVKDREVAHQINLIVRSFEDLHQS